MKKNEKLIGEIVADIIKADPSLAGKEKELSLLAEKLLMSKPEPKIDESFSMELRDKVLDLFVKKQKKTSSPSAYGRWSWVSFSCGLAIITLVLPFTMTVYPSVWPSSQKTGFVHKASAQMIVQVADNAFGSIGQNGNSGLESAKTVSSANRAYGMGDGVASGVGAGKMVPPAEADASVVGFIQQDTVKYTYAGGDFDPSSVDTPVYKRALSRVDLSSVAGVIKQMDFGSFRLSDFNDLKIDNISLKEDHDYGYYFSFSGENGSFNLSKNWEKWPQPYLSCQSDDCWKNQRVKKEELPSDEEAIKIADAFLSQYGFSVVGYDKPFVNDDWKLYYDTAENKDEYYFPEEVYVVYPLSINGLSVLDQSGNKSGLLVYVDVRTRRVSGLSSSLSLNFESSNYELVLDKEQIIKKAEKGGLNGGWYYYAEGGANPEVLLGSPELYLVQQWVYNEKIGKGEDVYVPCYIFPVENRPSNMLYLPKNVIVPLNKEFFQENNDTISPRPLVRPAVDAVQASEVAE